MRTASFACPLVLLAACTTTKHADLDRSAPKTQAAVQETEPIIHVIPLRFAAASDLARTVRAALVAPSGRKSAQIVPDDRTNSVIVTCVPTDFAGIEKLISQLDVEVRKP